ncbi:hypothetical protein A6A20_04345 [Volucribacter amazonae]|uniref:Uncharacterized protein n=1 Tax=Volucribacter amazonae TaxID=256731 RepID=A0A9X4PC62_9PAST|nr:hypothetical protein [Volucribacter amazonae]
MYARFLLFSLFLLSSFDIFLNIQMYSFNIRAFYFLEFLLIIILIFKNEFDQLIIGKEYLLLLYIILFIFINNTTVISRSIGYLLWLFASIMLIPIITIYTLKYYSLNNKIVVGGVKS